MGSSYFPCILFNSSDDDDTGTELKTAKLDGCVQQAENAMYGTGDHSFVLSKMDSMWLHHFVFGVCDEKCVIEYSGVFSFPERNKCYWVPYNYHIHNE